MVFMADRKRELWGEAYKRYQDWGKRLSVDKGEYAKITQEFYDAYVRSDDEGKILWKAVWDMIESVYGK